MSRSRHNGCACYMCFLARHQRPYALKNKHVLGDLKDGIDEDDERKLNLKDYCDGCDFCDSARLDWIEWLRAQDVYPPPALSVSLVEVL